jgi:ubiquinone/menaquinone biosynthesis C-methylase UbiE
MWRVTAADDLADYEMRKQLLVDVFDRGAPEYDQLGVDFFRPPGRELVALAEVSAGERVLDVGCGRGAVLFAAADAVGGGGRVVGIDLSPRMVELTAADAAARGLTQVTVVQGDAERPDFPPHSFGAVLAGLVIFFLTDPATTLRAYARLLAPRGRLGFTTFAAQDPVFDSAMRAAGSFVPDTLPPRAARQGPFASADGITAILGTAGFGDVRIEERTYESRFTDADHWLAWVWSHGGRATLERVPSEALPQALAAAKAEFAAARTPRGDYALRTTVRFTIARPS